MEVRALLCDAATVREGLLHVLGAGITRVNYQSYPAPLQASLAMMIVMHPTETGSRKHRLEIVLQSADGVELVKADAEFAAQGGPDLQPGEMVSAPIVFPMSGVGLPNAGAYSVEILINGQHQTSLGFVATVIDAGASS